MKHYQTTERIGDYAITGPFYVGSGKREYRYWNVDLPNGDWKTFYSYKAATHFIEARLHQQVWRQELAA